MIRFMLHKKWILLIVLMLAAGFRVDSHAQNVDITKYNSKIREIEENINILRSHHVDIVDQMKVVDSIKKSIQELQKRSEDKKQKEEIDTLGRLIELESASLDSELKLKIASIKRLELLYIIMLGFAVVTAVGFAFYIVIMYNKRK
jgi:hypothetical protein